jgi:hypothetical protein
LLTQWLGLPVATAVDRKPDLQASWDSVFERSGFRFASRKRVNQECKA